VQPVESVARRSAKPPACTSTVHASKLPRIAAQCNGVQPDNSTSRHLFSIIFSQLAPSTTYCNFKAFMESTERDSHKAVRVSISSCRVVDKSC
jgi:hypothetical protein